MDEVPQILQFVNGFTHVDPGQRFGRCRKFLIGEHGSGHGPRSYLKKPFWCLSPNLYPIFG